MNTLGLIGRKLGMTSIFSEDGSMIPVTVIKAGPCPIIQVKNKERDGYGALQIAYEQVSERKMNKPQKGHQFKAGKGFYSDLREVRVANDQEYKIGQELTVDMFRSGERVKISGKSKGKGFSGVIKRWNFAGAPASHGTHKVHRSPGAIGQCADPARVFKGKKMPGRMGNKKVTVANVEVVDIRGNDHLIILKGQVPGPKNSLLMICKQMVRG